MNERMPGFKIADNDNFPAKKAMEAPKNPELNLALVQNLKNALEEMRSSEEGSHRFSEAWLEKGMFETREFSANEAIAILNKSVRDQWEIAPGFYIALLKKIEDVIQDSGSEE